MKRICATIICICLFVVMFSGCGAKEKYIIATDDSYSPFCYVDTTGKPQGFDVEIIKAIAKNQKIKIEIVPLGIVESLDALDEKKADGVIAALVPDEELSEKCDFSNAYYNGEYVFAVHKNENKELIEMFNKGLKNIKEKGTYAKIYKSYFG